MKVKAIKPAFFNGSRVRVGQELEVPKGTPGSWFVPLAEFKAPEKAESKEPRTLSERARQVGKGPVDDLS